MPAKLGLSLLAADLHSKGNTARFFAGLVMQAGEDMAKLVRFRVVDGVAVVTLDAAPMNTLSASMRAGLWEAFRRIDSNDDIKAAVLMASGQMFSQGTDIAEWDAPEAQPTMSILCGKIETCSKPVIAAIQGPAMGSGVELIVACHFRLATQTAEFGLPAVGLGLVPNAGATQRVPRLIGPERALQMMISTTSIDAGSALRSGLIDGIVKGDLQTSAIANAQNLTSKGQGPRPTRANRTHLTDGHRYQAAIAKARKALGHNPQHAPHRIIDCVEAAPLLQFDAALAFETDAFEQCQTHPQSLAMRHMYRAERRIDSALIERDGAAFRPVDPMGKATVLRLRKAMWAAANILVDHGTPKSQIDAAMVHYGFRKGPFGGRDDKVRNDDIVRRLMTALLAEGAVCVAQGAVQNPSDIDALAVHGLGFPRRMGGPMRAAQTLGLIGVRKDMRDWATESEIWAVPELLDAAIKDARGFDAPGLDNSGAA